MKATSAPHYGFLASSTFHTCLQPPTLSSRALVHRAFNSPGGGMSRYTAEEKAVIAKRTESHWKDPKYRAKLIEKQKALGFRNYAKKVF